MKIAAAAILERGQVWTGMRHHLIMRDIVKARGEAEGYVGGEQGFVTDDGRFVGREEAAAIAFAAGQIPEPKKCLFSEDVFTVADVRRQLPLGRRIHTAIRRLLLVPSLPGDRVHDISNSYGYIVLPGLLGYYDDHGFRRPTKYHNCTMTGVH